MPGSEPGVPHPTYTEEQIRNAIEVWVQVGKFSLAQDKTGITDTTIMRWVRSPKYAELVQEIEAAHAREIRTRFKAGAMSFADDIALAQGAARGRLIKILEAAKRGEDVSGKEIASVLSALGKVSADVARVSGITEPDNTSAEHRGVTFNVMLEVQDAKPDP